MYMYIQIQCNRSLKPNLKKKIRFQETCIRSVEIDSGPKIQNTGIKLPDMNILVSRLFVFFSLNYHTFNLIWNLEF